MRSLLVLFLFACFCFKADAKPTAIYSVQIDVKPYWFSADFEFTMDDAVIGKVVRSGTGILRYYYDFFDASQRHIAQGITRVFSNGWFGAWGNALDIYDSSGNWIGKIEGVFWTKALTKFNFYNWQNEIVATAYLSTDSGKFVLTDPSNTKKILARFKGHFYGDFDYWDLSVYKDLEIDDRIVKIFSSFVADYRYSFHQNKQENHYHYHPDRDQENPSTSRGTFQTRFNN